jgi:hypothetical protein
MVAELNSKKHLLYVVGFLEPFLPPLALKTEDNEPVGKL